MPRVKIDYIVSFSSEDPENQASNLLAWEVNKKKWLCAKGEPSCSVVLQLAKAVKICTVHIGAYHSALVEVLAGRSETPNEPFQVLVPSSVFESPSEARRGPGAGAGRDSGAGAGRDRVRSFAGRELAAAAAAQRWDRLRVVCSQPYDKLGQYGLSFVHVYSPEEEGPGPAAPAPASAPVAPAPVSSDEEEFRPGELFAKHVLKSKDAPAAPAAPAAPTAPADTGAQIRQATSQALRNIPGSSVKLTRTRIGEPSPRRRAREPPGPRPAGPGPGPAGPRPGPADRARDALLYTEEDSRPHRRIDRVLSAHNDDKTTKRKPRDGSHKHNDKPRDGSHKNNDKPRDNRQTNGDDPSERRRDEAGTSKRETPPRARDSAASGDESTGDRSRKRTRSRSKHDDGGGEAAPLAGVVFVLSGYENPQRARVRAAACALGARYRAAWGPACTHLVCAFPNTPRLRALRASGDARAPAPSADWVFACARAGRRLPWRWFAAEPARRAGPPPPRDRRREEEEEDECDTDDEIDRVRQKMKKQRTDRAASPPRASSSDVSPPRALAPGASPPRALSPDGSPPRAPSPGASPPRTSSAGVPPPRAPSPDGSPPRASSPGVPPPRAPSPAADVSGSSDVMFVKDERIQEGVCVVESESDAATTEEEEEEEEEEAEAEAEAEGGGALPPLLAGVGVGVRGAPAAARRLARYVRAYGGLLLHDGEGEPEYVVCAAGAPPPAGSAPRVRAAWLWRLHRERRLCPVDDYLLP